MPAAPGDGWSIERVLAPTRKPTLRLAVEGEVLKPWAPPCVIFFVDPDLGMGTPAVC